MAIEDTHNQTVAVLHCAIDRVLGDAIRQLHAAVQADVNAQARVADLESVIDRLRRETVMLVRECEQYRLCIDRLESELSDQRAANRTYARLLTDVRAALGAVEDADLAEAARALVAELVAARAFIAAARTAGVDGLCTPEDAQRWLATLMEYKRAIGER